MAEKGIIMSTESVRAIIEGRKTQTRRAIKNQPPTEWKIREWAKSGNLEERNLVEFWLREALMSVPWQVGDLLWVRESWNYQQPEPGVREWTYRATHTEEDERWLSPMLMPKAAARIWLRVTDIRAERLNEITEADAWAEGIVAPKNSVTRYEGEARALYAELWDRINGKKQGRRWADNPWVWVIEFERVA